MLPAVVGLVGVLVGCAQPDTSSSGLAAPLEFGEIRLEVGVLDTPATHIFGQIRDVASLGDGRFVVLDGHSMDVRLFDSDGSLLATAGGHGEGPGELRGPEAITVTGDSTVLVLDGGNRLVRFRLQSSGLVHVGDLILAILGRDVCSFGDRVFVQGLHEGYGVHEIGPNGQIVNSLHPVPEDVGFDLGPLWNPLLRDEAVTGFLACLEDPPLIAMVSEWLPDIYAYDFHGDPRWKTQVPDYRPVEPVLTPDGGQTWDRGEGSDLVISMEAHPGGVLVVQTVHVGPGDDHYSAQPTTYLVDAGSGEIGLVEDDLPTLRALSWTVGFGVLTYPFPRVKLIGVTVHR